MPSLVKMFDFSCHENIFFNNFFNLGTFLGPKNMVFMMVLFNSVFFWLALGQYRHNILPMFQLWPWDHLSDGLVVCGLLRDDALGCSGLVPLIDLWAPLVWLWWSWESHFWVLRTAVWSLRSQMMSEEVRDQSQRIVHWSSRWHEAG